MFPSLPNKIMKPLVPHNVILYFLRGYSPRPGSGGGGGTIKQAGGAFKRMGTAKEEQYFHKKNIAVLEKLKERYTEELEYHDRMIGEHQAAIEKLKREQSEIEKEK